MIFKETKVYVSSYLPMGHRTAFLLALSREGVTSVIWRESTTGDYVGLDHAIIDINLFQSVDDKQRYQPSRFRSNNVEFIDVALNPPESSPQGSTFLHWTGSGAKIAEAVCVAEQKIMQRNLFQTKEVDEEFYLKLNMLGRSRAYIKTMTEIKKVAKTDAGVFIRGETGTGKELAARAIHYISDRAGGPFVPINCGAFTDELILSELFGHQKGAFTGANRDRLGLLEIADGGTLFLDEIDALSPMAQVALLRYLQEGEVRQVGGNKITKVDVRVVAASNKNISELLEAGIIREDLMYRLEVLSVSLPPLRKRQEDIQLLAQYYLAQIAKKAGHLGKYFSREVVERIQSYEWPGNFRELENIVQRGFLMFDGKVIDDVNCLFPNHNESYEEAEPGGKIYSFSAEKKDLLEKFEREYLDKLLQQTAGNISRAATIAQKERRSFTRLMQKHGLKRSSFL